MRVCEFLCKRVSLCWGEEEREKKEERRDCVDLCENFAFFCCYVCVSVKKGRGVRNAI